MLSRRLLTWHAGQIIEGFVGNLHHPNSLSYAMKSQINR